MAGRDDVEEATMALKGMLGIGTSVGGGSEGKSHKHEHHNMKSPNSDHSKKTKKQGHHHNKSNKKNLSNNTPKHHPTNGSNKKYANNKKKNDNNYAWSAFQSPPDASTLPMPAFGTEETSATEEEAVVLNQSEAEKMKTRSTETTVSSEDDIKALLNIPRTPTATKAETATPTMTGVNLAAMTYNHPATKPSPSKTPQQQPSSMTNNGNDRNVDAITMLMNNPRLPSSSHQQQHPLPQNNTALMPPITYPQYVTIQVQVPPILLPGRQMMVPPSNITGPFPIPVIVPEGIQPGMIVPVNVPMYMPPPHHPHHPHALYSPQQTLPPAPPPTTPTPPTNAVPSPSTWASRVKSNPAKHQTLTPNKTKTPNTSNKK